MTSFFVPGVPIAQPRQRHAVRNGHAINYLPKSHPIHEFKMAVQLHARTAREGILEGPVALTLLFLMPRPQSKIWKTKPMPREWHTGKPDADNLAKGIFDSCNGVLWIDDAQIVQCETRKMYAAGDEMPGVHVVVSPA